MYLVSVSCSVRPQGPVANKHDNQVEEQEGNVRNQAQQSLQSLPLHTAGGSGQCVGPPTGSLFSLGLSQSGQAEGLSYSLWGILARQANSLPHGSSWVRGLPQAGVAFPVQQ